jgi:hypothetical protein
MERRFRQEIERPAERIGRLARWTGDLGGRMGRLPRWTGDSGGRIGRLVVREAIQADGTGVFLLGEAIPAAGPGVLLVGEAVPAAGPGVIRVGEAIPAAGPGAILVGEAIPAPLKGQADVRQQAHGVAPVRDDSVEPPVAVQIARGHRDHPVRARDVGERRLEGAVAVVEEHGQEPVARAGHVGLAVAVQIAHREPPVAAG